MNITEFLQSNEVVEGVSLFQVLVWIFIIAVLLWLTIQVNKILRWLYNRLESRSESMADQPRTDSALEDAGDLPPGFDEPVHMETSQRIVQTGRNEIAPESDGFSSLLKDESSGDPGRAMHTDPGSLNQPPAATSAPTGPQAEFQVQSSQETRNFQGKQRSWTSRSLFGSEITGKQVELPRLESGDIPFADTSDYRWGTATPALASMMPETDERKAGIKKDLKQAGYYTPHAYENFAAVRYLGLMLPIVIFGGLLILVPPAIEWLMILFLVGGAILGWSLPRMFLRSKATQRAREIEQSLPDVIDLLNMCVSQGMTLKTALARVSWEIFQTYPAMAEELRIVGEQSELSTTEHALMNLNERVDVPELHSLTSLLIQTERMGTNVSDSLTEYSDAMRSTLQQRADQKANAATFKLLFPTVLCLMPAVYFFLLGPAVVELSEFFKGGGIAQYSDVDGTIERAQSTPDDLNLRAAPDFNTNR